MKKDFLLEIGTEEIPASYLKPAEIQLRERMVSFFSDQKVSIGAVSAYSTPRRLAVLVKDVDSKQEERRIEILGPSKNASPKALEGFTRAHGVSKKNLVVKQSKRGEVYCCIKVEPGRPTIELLKTFLPEFIQKMDFPKAMWWEKSKLRFARPIRWLTALYGERVIPFNVGGVRATRKSYGHRFLYPKAFLLKNPDQYVRTLEKKGVIVDRMKRREKILKEIEMRAKRVKAKPILDEELLEEVTDLVEYPATILGRFDPDFLQLPKEVVITAMRSHQRYFAVTNSQKALHPYFIAVVNVKNKSMDLIRKGNEAVLSARLADARFYWEEDRRRNLSEMVEGLKGVVWQENLGTLYDKTQRVMRAASELADQREGVDRKVLERAAHLAKADLLSSMIRDGKEFTRLEGVMGREYALASGEDPRVAQAIFEHTLPRFSGDELPHSLEGGLLSIVDKMDSIVGSFINGKVPTGSEDPLGIRRLGNGVVEVLMEKEIHLSLKELLKKILDSYYRMENPDAQLPSDLFEHSLSVKLGTTIPEFEAVQLRNDFHNFFNQRVKGLLLERGMRYDIADAVLGSGFDDIADVKRRGEALMKLRESQDFERVVTGQKRVANILRGEPTPPPFEASLLRERAERDLYEATRGIEKEFSRSLKERDYDHSLKILLTLRKPIDDLFDEVMVMVPDEELRKNRLALVKFVAGLFNQVADFSKIVIEGEEG
ncbi:glycine--tRNA ligase subunit beta [candidate division TA06 bacterium]|nr:glycine--tRNA ligase subunit beta [candidate division TA06 bacterium]